MNTRSTKPNAVKQQKMNGAPEIGSQRYFKLIRTYPSRSGTPDELKNRIRAALATAGYTVQPANGWRLAIVRSGGGR